MEGTVMNEVTLEPTPAEPIQPLPAGNASAPPGGVRVDAVGVSRCAGERRILQPLSLSVQPGELVAIAGGSGAGKSTLLDILAGLQPPSVGEVRHDGARPGIQLDASSRIGYVPQDDIIHVEMPLRRTLRYAARLRMPRGTSVAEADRAVEDTMRELDLLAQAD